MSGPLPDPDAERRNHGASNGFRTVVRDESRTVPPFPPEMAGGVPIDCKPLVDAYWREVWVTLGSELKPHHRFAVARAAILTAQINDLGPEAPGVYLSNLAKLEDSFGMSLSAQARLRITIVEKTDEKQGGAAGKGAPLVVMPSALAARAG